jgi:hypothetical protein
MTHPTLASLLIAHMKAKGIVSLTAAADGIGINPDSLKKLIEHGRKANSRTFPAYARFLGVAEDALAVQLGYREPLPTPPVQGDDTDDGAEFQPTPAPATPPPRPHRIQERLRTLSVEEMDLLADFASWLVRRRPKAPEPVFSPRRTEASRKLRARRIGHA